MVRPSPPGCPAESGPDRGDAGVLLILGLSDGFKPFKAMVNESDAGCSENGVITSATFLSIDFI